MGNFYPDNTPLDRLVGYTDMENEALKDTAKASGKQPETFRELTQYLVGVANITAEEAMAGIRNILEEVREKVLRIQPELLSELDHLSEKLLVQRLYSYFLPKFDERKRMEVEQRADELADNLDANIAAQELGNALTEIYSSPPLKNDIDEDEFRAAFDKWLDKVFDRTPLGSILKKKK